MKAGAGDTVPVRVGAASLPWAYLDPDGSPDGGFASVVSEAARREGLAVKFVLWRGGMEKALAGRHVDLWEGAGRPVSGAVASKRCGRRPVADAQELEARLKQPAKGTVFCFVYGPTWGKAVARPAAPGVDGVQFILAGSLSYLSGDGAELRGVYQRTLLLPAGARGLREALAETPSRFAEAESQAGARVLVVADNAVNLRLLSALLKKLGCEPVTADGGRAAQELMRTERFALVLAAVLFAGGPECAGVRRERGPRSRHEGELPGQRHERLHGQAGFA